LELVHAAQALPEGLEAGLELYIVAVRGKRPTTILRSFDKSNKGLPTPVSIDTRTKLLGSKPPESHHAAPAPPLPACRCRPLGRRRARLCGSGLRAAQGRHPRRLDCGRHPRGRLHGTGDAPRDAAE